MNNCSITGRLTKDPDFRMTTNNKACCGLSVAVPRSYGDQVDFLDVIVWGKLAEICDKYLSKGQMVGVTGAIQKRTYETKDGRKTTMVEIIANNVDFLSPRQEKREVIEAHDWPKDDGLPF